MKGDSLFLRCEGGAYIPPDCQSLYRAVTGPVCCQGGGEHVLDEDTLAACQAGDCPFYEPESSDGFEPERIGCGD